MSDLLVRPRCVAYDRRFGPLAERIDQCIVGIRQAPEKLGWRIAVEAKSGAGGRGSLSWSPAEVPLEIRLSKARWKAGRSPSWPRRRPSRSAPQGRANASLLRATSGYASISRDMGRIRRRRLRR
jgi:hypothetical protein